MEGNKRREELIAFLKMQKEAVTGTSLAKMHHVSRQVIVQDMALIRAQGIQVVSTSDGYLLQQIHTDACRRVFMMNHQLDDMQDELNTIVDHGATVMNVIVTHPVYGEISVDLMLSNRKAVQRFIERSKESASVPLMYLTGGDHYHMVEAPTEAVLNAVEQELSEKGYLVRV